MSNGLKLLIVKEVKELVRDPKILIGVIIMPLIIFPLMGSAINISQRSAEQAIISASFSIYTEDKNEMAKALVDFLDENLKIIYIESSDLEEALIAFQDTGTKVLLYIPKDYSENIKNDLKGNLKIFSNL
jgi:ABC-2 type transport system permease protein